MCLTIEVPVIAVRNRLPGQDRPAWAREIRALGELLARVVLDVRMGGSQVDRAPKVEDLIWAGMDEELAYGLLPVLEPDLGFVHLWRALESVRAAAGTLAAPDIVEAIETIEVGPPSRIEDLGDLIPMFAGEFMTLEEVGEWLPDAADLLERQMSELCGCELPKAPLTPEARALAQLDEAGWSWVTEVHRTTVMVHSQIGALVFAGAEVSQQYVQRSLDQLVEHGAPYVRAILDQGGHPVYVVQPVDGGRNLAVDGVRLAEGRSLSDAFETPTGLVAGLIPSFVGQLHANTMGMVVPEWIPCPSCGSPRCEVARLELERGFASLTIDAEGGEFASGSGAWLRVSNRKRGKPHVLTRVLRCPDCLVTRPFPGEEMLSAGSLPRRMAGERLPRGLNMFLEQATGSVRPLADHPLPSGIEEWVGSQKFGATAQFSDLLLTWKTSFRLPDKLVDLGRSITDGDVGWREAAARVGRSKERLLAWELRDLGNPADSAKRIIVVGIDPDFIATQAERWFGPVEDWTAVTHKTCWRGRLLGTEGKVELLLIQDFLGDPGEFAGGELDYEFLTGILRQAVAVVYAGDGLEAWDDEGIQWASDEGNLVAVCCPANQLALATPPDGVSWIDAHERDAVALVHSAVDRVVDLQTRAELQKVRRVTAGLADAVPRALMADHLVTPELFTLAVQAELAGTRDAWLILLNRILDALADEGRGSHIERKVRPSAAARRMSELGLPQKFVDAMWRLLEFQERTGVGTRMLRWLLPIFQQHPDPFLLARLHEVAARMPDLAHRYTLLNELRADRQGTRHVAPREEVLQFWWGCGAPAVWAGEPGSLPDLLSLAPSTLRGRATIFIGGASLRSGRRLAVLITGLTALEDVGVPEPGASTPTLVMEPPKIDLVRLQSRNDGGNLTVFVGQDDPSQWAEVVKGGAATVWLTPELSVPSPPLELMAQRLPDLDRGSLQEVAALMHTVTYEPDELVIRAGDRLGALGWIRSGQVADYRGRTLHPEFMIGAEFLLGTTPFPHDVVATEPLVLDLLSRSALRCLEEARSASLVVLEFAVANALARIVGPGAVEPGWFTPHRDEPVPFPGDWSLYWPILMRLGFKDLNAADLEKIYPETEPVSFHAGAVLYAPNAETRQLILVLDGELTVEDGRRRVKVGPGRFAGRLGILGGHERCTATQPTTALMLGERPARIWTERSRSLRHAMIATLKERLI